MPHAAAAARHASGIQGIESPVLGRLPLGVEAEGVAGLSTRLTVWPASSMSADLQRLVERVSVDAEQPAYAYRGDFSALYHLVDEPRGDAQIIGDLCHLEELVAPRKICPVLALSISRRHRPGTAEVHICIISLFVNSYVPYKSHVAGHFVNIPSHRAPRAAFVSWHLSNALAFPRRFLHGGGDAYSSC